MSLVSKKDNGKVRNPEKTDAEILQVLHQVDRPMRFQELAVRLDYKSGKLQTALKRLEKKYLIVKKKVPTDDGKSQITKIYYKDFNVEVVIPIRMDEVTASIIEKIPDVSDEYGSLDDLFKKALIQYFKKNIPAHIKIKAIEKAVADGLISKERGDKLLGR